MYRTILVPLDGSPRAERILPHVEAVAAPGATLIFLEVLEALPPHAEAWAPSTYAEAAAHRAGEVISYVETLAATYRGRGFQCRGITVAGPIVATVLAIAAREDADLIAMASHGRTGLGRVFYGSVAAGVLHRADRPLLLIRAQDE